MNTHKTAFPPIVDHNSKILLLGTMPGERSLKLQQYYAHKRNQFWRLIFAIFNHPFSDDYTVKVQLLLNKGIAVWDVLQYCERIGSSDGKISNEVPNNFGHLFQNYPNIRNIFFTSGKAEIFYDSQIGRDTSITFHKLPSPSSANTWKTFDEKLKEWELIMKYL